MIATTTTDAIAQVNTLATHTALSVSSLVSNFLILLVLTAIFFLFAWYVGRGPFVAVVLAFYSAYALYVAFPYMSYLPTAPPTAAILTHLGLYTGLTFAFYVILRRVVVSDFLYIGLFGLIALSFLAAAFLLALAYHIFLVSSIYHFTPAIGILFAPDKFFFWWFIAPAVGLLFLAR